MTDLALKAQDALKYATGATRTIEERKWAELVSDSEKDSLQDSNRCNWSVLWHSVYS